jgi:hypothetical protein
MKVIKTVGNNKIMIFFDVSLPPSGQKSKTNSSTLTMEGTGSSEWLVPIYKPTQRHIPKDHNFNIH